jgi:hypothetical protein
VITTNRGVGSWVEIFVDTTVAAATLDDESYRLRDHHATADTLRAPPPASANTTLTTPTGVEISTNTPGDS